MFPIKCIFSCENPWFGPAGPQCPVEYDHDHRLNGFCMASLRCLMNKLHVVIRTNPFNLFIPQIGYCNAWEYYKIYCFHKSQIIINETNQTFQRGIRIHFHIYMVCRIVGNQVWQI